MTLTKLVGGFCGAFLVFLLGGWAADIIYHEPEAHVAEGEEGPHQAYVIPVEDGEGAEEAVEEGPPFEEVFAAADATAGESEFKPCAACHSLEGENKTGPYLDGIVGRPVQAVEGFDYSGALTQVGDTWTPEALNVFLENPKGAVPETKMNFPGVRSVEDRANLIAYLATFGG